MTSGDVFDPASLLVPAASVLPSNAAYLSHLNILAENPSLIRLQSNENTEPPSPLVREALMGAYDDANLYASPMNPLRQALASRYGVSPSAVLVGAGATEGIEAMLRTFVRAGDHVVLATPTWPVYRRRLSALEADFVEVPMRVGERSYHYDSDAMLEAVTPETKLVIIVTPNNPTGNLMDEPDVRRFLAHDCMVLVDHAYSDFTKQDLSPLLHGYDNLVMAFTFAKSYSLAGLRLGYIIGNPVVMDYIERFLVPGGSVSSASLHAGLAALEDQDFHDQQVARIVEQRERFIKAARELGLKAFDSGGNFFAIDASDYPGGPTGFGEAFLEQGVVIRPLTERLARITIGTARENDAAIRALRAVMERVG
jgi:histidinol-phosphate aminotransferase